MDRRWRRERGTEDRFVRVLIADFQLVHQFFIHSLDSLNDKISSVKAKKERTKPSYPHH